MHMSAWTSYVWEMHLQYFWFKLMKIHLSKQSSPPTLAQSLLKPYDVENSWLCIGDWEKKCYACWKTFNVRSIQLCLVALSCPEMCSPLCWISCIVNGVVFVAIISGYLKVYVAVHIIATTMILPLSYSVWSFAVCLLQNDCCVLRNFAFIIKQF